MSNRRLSDEQIREILNSPESGVALSKRLGVSNGQISRIRAGTRLPLYDRTGTLYDPDPDTAHPDSPLHKRARKRLAHWPPYLTRHAARLKPGYELRPIAGEITQEVDADTLSEPPAQAEKDKNQSP